MRKITIFFRWHVRIALCALVCFIFSAELQAQKKKPPVKADPNAGFAIASYKGIQAGQYMKNWLLAGPFLVKEDTASDPDMQLQENFFNEDLLTQVTPVAGKPIPAILLKGKSFAWKPYSGTTDAIDLDAIYKKVDYAAVYALAEIKTDSALTAFLGVGSDDGIKVWLNGKQVHKNWTGRAVTADQDIIPVSLVKGSNQLLIKVQDMAQGWGFTIRFLDRDALSERLVSAAAKGNLDEVTTLLNARADINKKNAVGLTPLTAAQLNGREDVAALLLEKGAVKTNMPTATQLVDGLYSSLQGKESPGIAILVAKNGEIVYKKGFGYANLKSKTLVSPETKFRIGSITKQFTASAILKLQEDGKLKVTDKLSKYIPDFPRGSEVTLHHLLTHTSGIHSYTGKDDFLTRVLKPVSPEELINYFKNDPYDFNPGEQYRYNNSGYFLLGYIIEKVSGKNYAQYLKETFFMPLHMYNTGVYATWISLDKEALGYTRENDSYLLALNWNMNWAGGAGALYSTVEDLYKWNEAVFHGKVLDEKSINAAFTSVVLNDGKTPSSGEYGYGWGMNTYRGLLSIGHSGGLHGFTSQLVRFPKENVTVVLLSNLVPPEVNMNPYTVAEYFLWDKMAKQNSYAVASVPDVDVSIYAGRYDFQNGAVMTITAEGKELFAQLSGQPKFPIFPSGPDEFFWKVVEARIKFIKDEKGTITHGHFVQGAFAIDAKKLKDDVIVSIKPELYTAYAGKYDYGNNIFITVTNENSKLFVQATNQPKYEIFPVSETEFTVKELNARLTFVREPAGKVSKLIVDLAGQKKESSRVE
ncbi:serine hydrolase [Ohtaekwangia koreensis]|uniref:CubicO group peptidase, beta-lactamase class C family n=1 Tax=Ohtaekwangia koreensis TaxID=688867 RepID=A0A1T5KSM6_9BACT|nr:serine hydrolase [Ohtaekwangia koreensis]SKC66697.1 CubicO group peptidase, beta-lactamase class C family [Ohtaekwangia koreensis]